MFNTGDESKKTNSQLNNVLAATGATTLIWDKELRVINYTSGVTAYIKLSDSDIGRPFYELTPNFKYEKIADVVQEVLKTRTAKEIEVQQLEGIFFQLGIAKYPSSENKING
jgi:two-component system CheB/CheR fusion protein